MSLVQQSAETVAPVSTASASVTFGAATTAGNLVVIVCWNVDGTGRTFASSGFGEDIYRDTQTGGCVLVMSQPNIAGGVTSYTVTFGGSQKWRAIAYEFDSVVTTASPGHIEASSSNGANTGGGDMYAAPSGSIDTTQGGPIVAAFLLDRTVTSIGGPSGWTGSGTTGTASSSTAFQGYINYKIASGSSTDERAATTPVGSGPNYDAVIVAYKGVSAAPVFSGSVPDKTGTTGAAFAWGTPSLASYFSGSGITYTVSSSLAGIGLSINSSTGVISGTGVTGTWTGTATATNGDGSDDTDSFTITISPAPADLSSPTVTGVGATTATCGFSTDTATGNGYFLRRTGLSAASAATIISTGESQAISGTGAQTRAMTGFTSGLTYYVDMAQTGSTEVVTAGPFYPGTGRPVSDVDVTGWTASTGSDLWAMLDEDTASDSDYVTSPALSGSATTGSHALDKTYPAGTYSIKVRAKTDTGAGTLAVRLLNGSNVSQGVTADQAITSTWTTYTLPITITGDATRIRYEVVAA